MADVEIGIAGQPGRHRVDGGPDGHRHDQRVEVGPELAGALEMGEQLPQRRSPLASRMEKSYERAAVGAAGVERDLDGRASTWLRYSRMKARLDSM